jgi:hypothetical protein
MGTQGRQAVCKEEERKQKSRGTPRVLDGYLTVPVVDSMMSSSTPRTLSERQANKHTDGTANKHTNGTVNKHTNGTAKQTHKWNRKQTHKWNRKQTRKEPQTNTQMEP